MSLRRPPIKGVCGVREGEGQWVWLRAGGVRDEVQLRFVFSQGREGPENKGAEALPTSQEVRGRTYRERVLPRRAIADDTRSNHGQGFRRSIRASSSQCFVPHLDFLGNDEDEPRCPGIYGRDRADSDIDDAVVPGQPSPRTCRTFNGDSVGRTIAPKTSPSLPGTLEAAEDLNQNQYEGACSESQDQELDPVEHGQSSKSRGAIT
jgi:hypothetical protein